MFKMRLVYYFRRKLKFSAKLGSPIHSDLKVSSSQAKTDENFANYFLKTKANKQVFCSAKMYM